MWRTLTCTGGVKETREWAVNSGAVKWAEGENPVGKRRPHPVSHEVLWHDVDGLEMVFRVVGFLGRRVPRGMSGPGVGVGVGVGAVARTDHLIAPAHLHT